MPRGDLTACRIIEFPVIRDIRGNLTFVEHRHGLDFPIKRVYYLYDVPAGAERGGHAHHELQQMIIAPSGSFDVVLDDGSEQKVVTLDRPWMGLRIGSMIWRELRNFTSGAVCLVLASTSYEETDYIRDYAAFKKLALEE